MSNHRKTFWVSWRYPINGLEKTAHKIADMYQVDGHIDTDVIKTGWFSKKYEYNIVYSGEKEQVEKAYNEIYKCAKNFQARLNAL